MSKASLFFKKAIADQISTLTGYDVSRIIPLLKRPRLAKHGDFAVPMPKLECNTDIPKSTTPSDHGLKANKTFKEIAEKIHLEGGIVSVGAIGPFINIHIDKQDFVRRVISQIVDEQERYGIVPHRIGKKVLIEYSSPNIAKPFHVGHLRGTILGNFLARIHRAKGYDVYELNYLGDWGAQYGLLAIGFQKFGDEKLMKEDPIQHLFKTYVHINQLAEQDESIREEARSYFLRMEKGDEEALSLWRRLRELSIEKYKSFYEKFPVVFDEYTGEFEASQHVNQALERVKLKISHLLFSDEDGCLSVNLSEWELGKPKLQRSDSSSLYLLRDISAGLIRKQNHSDISKSIYVIGHEQSYYMRQLFKIFELIDYPIPVEYVPFGRVLGMSTRKGNIVLLEDILDKSKERMINVMQENSVKWDEVRSLGVNIDTEDPFANPAVKAKLGTKKYLISDEAVEYVAHTAGLSAVIVQDFSATRIKDYEFEWGRMLDSQGDTGVYLQYAHARLCGISRQTPVDLPKVDEEGLIAPLYHLKEQSAYELARLLGEFPDTIDFSFANLDPQIIVHYLMEVGHCISAAMGDLRVKGRTENVGDRTPEGIERAWLFWCARQVLSNGMKLIGLQPLERM